MVGDPEPSEHNVERGISHSSLGYEGPRPQVEMSPIDNRMAVGEGIPQRLRALPEGGYGMERGEA